MTSDEGVARAGRPLGPPAPVRHVMFMYELSQGRDGNPYGLLGAVAGLAYLVVIAVLRMRS